MSKNLSLREQQKAEAIKRMRMLSLHPNVINEFITDNTLHKSEDYGVVYWLDDKEKQIVKEFEKSTMLSFITSLKVIPRDHRKFCVKVNRSHPFRQVLDI